MEVKWYSGYKGEESPSLITINGEPQIIRRVIREELIEDSLTGRRKRIFEVETNQGIYRLAYNGNNWEVLSETRHLYNRR